MPKPEPAAAPVAPRPLLLDPRRSTLSPKTIGLLLETPSARFDIEPGGPAKTAGSFVIGGREDGRIFHFEQGIAVIQIRGPLFNDSWIDLWGGWSGYKGIALQLEAALADPEVRAILFDIDSPGGVVNGSLDLVDQIFSSRGQVPMWAMANDTATSAAYGIASAADMVMLPRFGSVGSIGVWTAHIDISAMLEEFGWKITLIFSGAQKVDGNPWEPLPDAVRDRFQAEIDRMRQVFAETVARNRSVDTAAVLATEAAIFDDSDAEAAGLADAVATEAEVLEALLEEIGSPAAGT